MNLAVQQFHSSHQTIDLRLSVTLDDGEINESTSYVTIAFLLWYKESSISTSLVLCTDKTRNNDYSFVCRGWEECSAMGSNGSWNGSFRHGTLARWCCLEIQMDRSFRATNEFYRLTAKIVHWIDETTLFDRCADRWRCQIPIVTFHRLSWLHCLLSCSSKWIVQGSFTRR